MDPKPRTARKRLTAFPEVNEDSNALVLQKLSVLSQSIGAGGTRHAALDLTQPTHPPASTGQRQCWDLQDCHELPKNAQHSTPHTMCAHDVLGSPRVSLRALGRKPPSPPQTASAAEASVWSLAIACPAENRQKKRKNPRPSWSLLWKDSGCQRVCATRTKSPDPGPWWLISPPAVGGNLRNQELCTRPGSPKCRLAWVAKRSKPVLICTAAHEQFNDHKQRTAAGQDAANSQQFLDP